MWNPFSFLGSLFKKIGKFVWQALSSKQAIEAYQIVMEKFFPEAKPIVASIRAIAGSPKDATAQDILDLYAHFEKAIPAIVDTAEARGNAMLNLAVALLRERLAPQGWTNVSVNDLQTAVNTALLAIKAEEK